MNERIRQLKEQAWTLVSIEERDRGELCEEQVKCLIGLIKLI